MLEGPSKLADILARATARISGPTFAQGMNASGTTAHFVTEQPANEWLARVFIGQAVHNTAGEVVGYIKALVFDRKG